MQPQAVIAGDPIGGGRGVYFCECLIGMTALPGMGAGQQSVAAEAYGPTTMKAAYLHLATLRPDPAHGFAVMVQARCLEIPARRLDIGNDNRRAGAQQSIAVEKLYPHLGAHIIASRQIKRTGISCCNRHGKNRRLGMGFEYSSRFDSVNWSFLLKAVAVWKHCKLMFFI